MNILFFMNQDVWFSYDDLWFLNNEIFYRIGNMRTPWFQIKNNVCRFV